MPLRSTKRTPESCRFREPIHQSTDATCRLLVELSGALKLKEFAVERTVCEACCDSFEPTAKDLNPVVASRLAHLADAVIERDGVPGCSFDQANALLTFAEESLPVVLFDEDDITAPPSYAPQLSEVSVERIATCLPLPQTSEASELNESRKGAAIEWAVGVTTCARRNPTLIESLNSMVTAGWSDYRLFVDGSLGATPNEQHNLPDSLDLAELPGNASATIREPAAGAWSNYYLSLSELYQRQPRADAYMLIQDDSLFARVESLREYVDQLLCLVEPGDIVSLYCSAEDTRERAGWFRYADSWRYGALAFVYTSDAVVRFLQHDDVISRQNKFSQPNQAGIDTVIGDWTTSTNTPLWYSTPSLIQHLGDVSTIWKTARAVGLRRASSFLETELIPK